MFHIQQKRSSQARELHLFSYIPIKFSSDLSKSQKNKMGYFMYSYCLGNASWHTELKSSHNHSEVRLESASENKTQDITNASETTGTNTSFCHFMLPFSALSRCKHYYILLCKIPSPLLLRS